MKIILKWMLFFASTLLFWGCTNQSASKNDTSQLYIEALEELMRTDDALNHEMAYIAIDMEQFVEVDEEQKEEIKQYFAEKYEIEIMEASLDDLREQGLFDDETLYLEGILLSITKVEMNEEVRMEATKYRSGTGAIGLEIILHQVDDEWAVKESKMLWISQRDAVPFLLI